MCYHSENSLSIHEVSLKNMVYRTISLSYLSGQGIYVIFFQCIIFHIEEVIEFNFLYSNVVVFLTYSEVLQIQFEIWLKKHLFNVIVKDLFYRQLSVLSGICLQFPWIVTCMSFSFTPLLLANIQ